METRISSNAFSASQSTTANYKQNTTVDSTNSSQIDKSTDIKITKNQDHTLKELEKAIRAIQGPQKQLEVSMHDKTHTIMIKVMDKDTGELIREVPPEKILDLAARMMEINGILLDEKV